MTQQSGTINYSSDVTTTTGMILIRFTSDEGVTAAGWTATWSVVAAPPPPGRVCNGRTVTAASGSVDDGSGSSASYGDK